MAEMIASAVGVQIEPVARGEFRPGEMRYLAWIRGQGSVRDYFAQAEQLLRAKRVVQPVSINATVSAKVLPQT